MADQTNDLELKFDGPAVRRLNGAPAEAVIASLNAIQRMVYIIGMRAEGRPLSERLKPTLKVKREYSVVCKAPQVGSHIQPFGVASQTGQVLASSSVTIGKLLSALRAFDSGSQSRLEREIPNARERWFLAKAASGLLPAEDSDLEVTVRAGSRGPFAFKAERARALLSTYDTPRPPAIDEETISGKLRAIDYQQTIMSIKPGQDPMLRMDYPLQFEPWLFSNVRKRLKITGRPKVNARGDISSFDEIYSIVELEPHLNPVDRFTSDGRVYATNKPITLPITVYWADRLFGFVDPRLGIDVVVSDPSEIREAVLVELDLVWRQYAQARDSELDEEARQVKQNLLSRFGSPE